jgi:hypothetical protein
LLSGATAPVQRPRAEVVFHFPHYQGDTPHSAILLGKYKLLESYEAGERQLFDLEADLGERNDLAKALPQIADDLAKRLRAYLTSVGAAMPKQNPDYDPAREPAGTKGGKGGRKPRRSAQ